MSTAITSLLLGDDGDLENWLLAQPKLTQLIGRGANARISWELARKAAGFPHLVLAVQESEPIDHLTGSTYAERTTIQAFAQARRPRDAYVLALTLRQVLRNFRSGRMINTQVAAVQSFRLLSGDDPPPDGTDKPVHWAMLPFQILHFEQFAIISDKYRGYSL